MCWCFVHIWIEKCTVKQWNFKHTGLNFGIKYKPVDLVSSVGITTRYGQSGDRIPVEELKFSAPVHTGLGAHPASYTMSMGSFPGASHGLWYFNSCIPTHSLAEVLIFSLTLNLPTTTIVAQPFNVIKWQLKFNLVALGLVFSRALYMSSLSLKFSKAAKLLDILICNWLLPSSTFSVLRLNLSPSNFCAASLLSAKLSLNL